MNKSEKKLSRLLDNDIFDIYYKTKSIEFIIDIKENLNKYGFNILDETNENFTENFYKLLEENLICNEQKETNDSQQESDDNDYNNEFY